MGIDNNYLQYNKVYDNKKLQFHISKISGNPDIIIDGSNLDLSFNNVNTSGSLNSMLVFDFANKRINPASPYNNGIVNLGYKNSSSDRARFKNIYTKNLICNTTQINDDIRFYVSNETTRLDSSDDGTGGTFEIKTREDGEGGSLTEKLRINNIGAIGIGGANYGTSGKVLTSNGSTSAVSWQTPNEISLRSYNDASFGNVDISGTLNVGVGKDITSTFGYASIGYTNNSNDSQHATFAHKDNMNSTDYALRQENDGDTIINAKDNKLIILRNNNNSGDDHQIKFNGGCMSISHSSVGDTDNNGTRLIIKQTTDGTGDNPGNAIKIHQAISNDYWRIGLDDSGDPELCFRFNEENKGGYLDSESNVDQITFTGQHRCIINKNFNVLLNIGLIVSTNNKFFNLNNTINPNINESLPICNLTNIDNDKKVFGVISSEEDESYIRKHSTGNFVSIFPKTNINEQRLYINSLGEGAIWVCNKNGPLENGDYITSSSVTGYGMKQDDDLLHNYTVAKITCDCDFDLTKIVKQKVNTFIDASNEQNLVYDSNGDIELVNDLDTSGNIQMEYKYDTRFLDSSGNIVEEGSHSYIACFVGCTYHCG